MTKFIALAFLLGAAPARAALRVVTTTSDLAALAREIAADKATVDSIAPAAANPHSVDAKPSYVVKLMKADAYVQNGLELESTWAPLLLQSARSRELMAGGRGHIDASEAIEPIEVPQNLSRSGGDVHPGGNPHYLTDPENARKVARHLAEKFGALSPGDADSFKANLTTFEAKLDDAQPKWEARLAAAKGKSYVSYHREWSYFAKRYGLERVGEIEPKPGIPPTGSHTAKLIEEMKAKGVKLVMTDIWYERRTPESIARATGASVAHMALFPGADGTSKDYFGWMEECVARVERALAAPPAVQ